MNAVADRLKSASLVLGNVAWHLPWIAPHCTAMPDIDVSDEDCASVRWDGGHINSFSLSFFKGHIIAVLSEPKAGPGWAKRIELGDKAALVAILKQDDATPFLRRYGPKQEPGS